MNFSARNKKVAFKRWERTLAREREHINNSLEGLHKKSILCGFLAGDGSVQIRKDRNFLHYETKFFPDDKLMLQTYLNAMRFVYGKTPSIRKRDNVYHARLTSRTVVEDLLRYATFGIGGWCLPLELFAVPNSKEAWLRAFFSAEAYVGSNQIKVQTINKRGMDEVSKLLNELGIDHRRYEYIPKNEKWSPVSMIFINKKAARKSFYKKIGFYHSRKTDALKKSLGL